MKRQVLLLKRRVIIDTDPGIDDALALIFAIHSPELQIEGITIAPGNVKSEIGATNVLRVLDIVGNTAIPVFYGAKAPLFRKLIPATRIHGEDGLGDCGWPTTKRSVMEQSGVDYLIEQVKSSPKELTLICLGPLTNLALAIAKDPDAIALFKEIVIMGGAARVAGNVSPVAEFNFWSDPEAAHQVLEWSKVPLVVIGLDVTRQTLLTPLHLKFLKHQGTPLSDWLVKLTLHYLNIHWELNGIVGCTLNDPLAVLAAFMPELLTFQDYSVDVATDGLCRGQMVVDYTELWGKRRNARLATDVNVDAFLEEFLVRILKDDSVTVDMVHAYLQASELPRT